MAANLKAKKLALSLARRCSGERPTDCPRRPAQGRGRTPSPYRPREPAGERGARSTSGREGAAALRRPQWDLLLQGQAVRCQRGAVHGGRRGRCRSAGVYAPSWGLWAKAPVDGAKVDGARGDTQRVRVDDGRAGIGTTAASAPSCGRSSARMPSRARSSAVFIARRASRSTRGPGRRVPVTRARRPRAEIRGVVQQRPPEVRVPQLRAAASPRPPAAASSLKLAPRCVARPQYNHSRRTPSGSARTSSSFASSSMQCSRRRARRRTPSPRARRRITWRRRRGSPRP